MFSYFKRKFKIKQNKNISPIDNMTYTCSFPKDILRIINEYAYIFIITKYEIYDLFYRKKYINNKIVIMLTFPYNSENFSTMELMMHFNEISIVESILRENGKFGKYHENLLKYFIHLKLYSGGTYIIPSRPK